MSEPTIFGLSSEFYFQRDVENRLRIIEIKLEMIEKTLQGIFEEQHDKERHD